MTLPKLALLPLLAVVGCAAGPDRPPSDGPASPEAEQLAPMQVVFTSTDLARSTAVGTVSRTIDGVGIMHLTVPVRALTDEDLTVDYRFTYFDENRATVDAPTAWQTRTLHAGTFESLTGDAPSPRARDFELDVRHAQ